MTESHLDLTSLNEHQRRAVEHSGGPLMIVAGAGSGKTRVIVYRIAKLLKQGVPPYRILAVTFTNKAAREMRERIEAIAPERSRDLWMGTFHSVCSRILRIDGLPVGVDRNFVIYDDADQIGTIRDIVKNLTLDERRFQPRAVLSAISRAKERLDGPDTYSKNASDVFEKDIAKIYRVYQARLAQANALDFDDLIVKTVRLLEQDAAVREKYQDRFLHVLVDEFQDVNYSQYRLAEILSAKHRNLTVVGDDDQSIYGWRGADVELMLRFGKDHHGSTFITLDQNYRSTSTILEAAHAVVRHIAGRNDKRLWTDNQSGMLVQIGEAGTENDEARLIVDTIQREVLARRRQYGDFAVLYRTNAQSRSLEEAMLTHQVPHVLLGGQRFYDRKEVKDLIAYLRLAWNPADDAALRRVVNVPPRGIGIGTLAKIETIAQESGLALFKVLTDLFSQLSLNKKSAASLKSFVRSIEDVQSLLFEDRPVATVIKSLLQSSGYIDHLRAERTDEAQSRLENLQELLNVAAQFDENAGGIGDVGAFLEMVALVSDVDSLMQAGDGVKLMTLHSAKGLEFPVVFLSGLEEGVFPHSRSRDSERELEEERRLCYVGMTRAQEQLFMTSARRRSHFGQSSFNARSRFIEDIPPHLTDRMPGSELSPRYQGRAEGTILRRDGESRCADPEPVSARWQPPFGIGEQVNHRKFGTGIVVACAPMTDDTEVTVAFPGTLGVKKLVQSVAKLEKQ